MAYRSPLHGKADTPWLATLSRSAKTRPMIRYDTSDHDEALRAANVTPHVAQNNSPTKTGKQRKSAIDGRTTRHAGYGMSQTRRKMIECIFGGKQHGTLPHPHSQIARCIGGFRAKLTKTPQVFLQN